MANNLKDYDAFQVLRSVFEVDNNCLRVCVVNGSGGGEASEVIIDHTSDSIRLGDGTSLVTTTTTGSKVGLDVNLVNSPTVSTPTITNVSIGSVNTQFSYTLLPSTKRYAIRSRNGGKLNLAFTSGQTGANYWTVRPGTVYAESDIITGGVLTLYFQLNKTGVVEILEWI